MHPTLTMRHRPTSETLVVECDHGLTTAHGEEVATHEQFGATLGALMPRRECDCRPTVVVDEWPSLAEAIDLHPDEDRPEFGEVVGAQRPLRGGPACGGPSAGVCA